MLVFKIQVNFLKKWGIKKSVFLFLDQRFKIFYNIVNYSTKKLFLNSLNLSQIVNEE